VALEEEVQEEGQADHEEDQEEVQEEVQEDPKEEDTIMAMTKAIITDMKRTMSTKRSKLIIDMIRTSIKTTMGKIAAMRNTNSSRDDDMSKRLSRSTISKRGDDFRAF
jgi:hypothetical protein